VNDDARVDVIYTNDTDGETWLHIRPEVVLAATCDGTTDEATPAVFLRAFDAHGPAVVEVIMTPGTATMFAAAIAEACTVAEDMAAGR